MLRVAKFTLLGVPLNTVCRLFEGSHIVGVQLVFVCRRNSWDDLLYPRTGLVRDGCMVDHIVDIEIEQE